MGFRSDVLQKLELTRACEPGIFWAKQHDLQSRRQAWERLKNETDPRWLPAIPSFMLDTVHRFAAVDRWTAVRVACWFCRKTPMPGNMTTDDFLSDNANKQLATVEAAAGLVVPQRERPKMGFRTSNDRLTLAGHAAAAVWDAVFYASAFANFQNVEALQRTSFYCVAAATRLSRGNQDAFREAITAHVLHIFVTFRDLFRE